jgi:hypothetical protein
MPINPFQILAALGMSSPPSMVGGFPIGALSTHIEGAPDSMPAPAASGRLRSMTATGRALAGMAAAPNAAGGRLPPSYVEGPTGEPIAATAGSGSGLQYLTPAELVGPVARDAGLPPHVSRMLSALQALGRTRDRSIGYWGRRQRPDAADGAGLRAEQWRRNVWLRPNV